MNAAVDRAEFSALAGRVERLDVKTADELRALAVNMAEVGGRVSGVADDVADIKESLRSRDQARVVSRRWAIGISVAGLAAIGGLYPLVSMLAGRR